MQNQARCIAHEIKNQISICELYSQIIKKHLEKDNIKNPSIDNALICITRALKIMGNNLIDLKTLDNLQMKKCDLREILKDAINLSTVYIQDKDIKISLELEDRRAGVQKGKQLTVESCKLKVENLSSQTPSPDGERICERTERSESGLRKDGAYCGEATNAELLEQRANSRQGWDGVISTNNNKNSQEQLTDKNLSTFQPFNHSTEIALSPYVYIDENKFLACVVNIIKNAVEAIEHKGEINVSTYINDKVHIFISNNGEPIKDIEHLFDEGFTTKKTGSGLGLAICKEYLKEQNAELKLSKSTKDITEFEITLPVSYHL